MLYVGPWAVTPSETRYHRNEKLNRRPSMSRSRIRKMPRPAKTICASFICSLEPITQDTPINKFVKHANWLPSLEPAEKPVQYMIHGPTKTSV